MSVSYKEVKMISEVSGCRIERDRRHNNIDYIHDNVYNNRVKYVVATSDYKGIR